MINGESRSEAELRRAMERAGLGERRANPPYELRFDVLYQLPDADGQWVSLQAGLSDLEIAIDEARASSGSLPIGTAFCVRSIDPWWMGVIDDKRVVRDAPKLPTGTNEENWLAAWEGEYAKATWMMDQCGRVDQRAVVRACLACVRPISVEVRKGAAASAIKRALEALDAWLSSGGTTAVAEDIRENLLDFARGERWGGGPTRGEWVQDAIAARAKQETALLRYYALFSLGETCACASAEKASDVACQAMNVSSDVAEYMKTKRGISLSAADRAVAPLVRSVISVGEVMASRFRRGSRRWRMKGLR